MKTTTKTIELTVTPDYVPAWSVADAIRELYQNALDAEALDPSAEMISYYDAEDEKLTILSRNSHLNTDSLLLGKTNKRDEAESIGQFGEGYKVAALALLREGISMHIFNHKMGEVWRPIITTSQTFHTAVLAFEIRELHSPSEDLVIELHPITKETYEKVTMNTLHLQEEYPSLQTAYGEVLLAPEHSGLVFTNGLFVCSDCDLTYGYNVKPQHLPLGRDRSIVSSFDVQWLTAKLWAELAKQEQHVPTIMSMLENNNHDVRFLYHSASSSDIYDRAYEFFISEYGDNALPIIHEKEKRKVPKNYKGIVVPVQFFEMIQRSALFVKPEDNLEDPMSSLWDWYESVDSQLTSTDNDRFKAIYLALERILS